MQLERARKEVLRRPKFVTRIGGAIVNSLQMRPEVVLRRPNFVLVLANANVAGIAIASHMDLMHCLFMPREITFSAEPYFAGAT